MQNGDATNATDPTNPACEESDVDRAVASVSGILARVDPEASIDAVVKVTSGATMLRITPSSADGGRFLALQTALRLSFPFDAVAAVENMCSGAVQLQMVVATSSEQLSLARRRVRELASMRLLSSLSNLLFAGSALSFVLLLQHANMPAAAI